MNPDQLTILAALLQGPGHYFMLAERTGLAPFRVRDTLAGMKRDRLVRLVYGTGRMEGRERMRMWELTPKGKLKAWGAHQAELPL